MLGILGLGSHSTLHFIQRLNEMYTKQNGGYSTCPFKLLNVDFNQINPYLPNQFEVLQPLMRKELMELYQLGVSRIVVPNITIHETIDLLGGDFDSVLIHPLKIAQEKVKNLNLKKVLILGTRYTMESDYVRSFFQNYDLIDLNEAQKETIDSIRKKVYETGYTVDLKNELLQCIENVIDESTFIVIACTELSVLKIEQENCLDLLELLVNESV